jgi:hypothetical protein
MQFVDFDEKKLFGNDSFEPTAGYNREFKLYNIKKKQAFQERLKELYVHQRIPDRVALLAETFSSVENITSEDIANYTKHSMQK